MELPSLKHWYSFRNSPFPRLTGGAVMTGRTAPASQRHRGLFCRSETEFRYRKCRELVYLPTPQPSPTRSTLSQLLKIKYINLFNYIILKSRPWSSRLMVVYCAARSILDARVFCIKGGTMTSSGEYFAGVQSGMRPMPGSPLPNFSQKLPY